MVDNLTPFEALTQAVELAGSQAELARICCISSTAVWKWVQSGKRIPAEYVLCVEQATGVSRHLLRPDIYPLETASFPASYVAEPTLVCGPVLSTRVLPRHGKTPANLDNAA
jgi:DNA-binding transcriptional regulator YdaS (Cro superfamily)